MKGNNVNRTLKRAAVLFTAVCAACLPSAAMADAPTPPPTVVIVGNNNQVAGQNNFNAGQNNIVGSIDGAGTAPPQVPESDLRTRRPFTPS
ncbi:hypothetical protein ACU686_03845 [Yinghuangia aomiensis]